MKSQKYLHKKGMELSLNLIITIVIALVVLAVMLAFWNVLYKAIIGLPG